MANTYYSTYLIGQGQLLHEGWRRLLRGTSFDLVGAGEDIASLRSVTENGGSPPDLVILDLANNDSDTQSVAQRVKEIAPDAKVVFVMADASAETLAAGFAGGTDGFLDKDVSYEAMLESLRLVMLGQKVYPTRLLSSVISGSVTTFPTAAQNLRTDNKLSDRELQILRCLVAGYSNKVIANRLSITDTTVKVHLKNILRKINVSNRTQAAIWAVSRGLVRIDASGLASQQGAEKSTRAPT